jgi:PD-(D/E)XK nuclease superfamily protein
MLLDTAIMGKECENSTSSSTIKDENQSTPIRKPRRANTKRTGELSEAAFLLKAKTLGFGVSRPWGDSERYDFVLDSGHRLWRAQIKCTASVRARGYDIQPTHTDQTRKAPYTIADIDVLFAHIIPLDIWYVLPVEAFAPCKSLRFYPQGCKRARFEQHREAWSLLRPQAKAAAQGALL